MSVLEIKSLGGKILVTTERYVTLTDWGKSADLTWANLRGADLGRADLGRANLSRANLSEADLREANLSGAYLRGAYLGGADLRGAYLGGADLSGAYLRGANLSGANLSGADLSGAYLGGTAAVIDGGQDGRGYRVVGWLRDGQLMFRAGCRNFTLAQARAHWGGTDYLESHDEATQAEMVARVELIVTVARARGWTFEE